MKQSMFGCALLRPFAVCMISLALAGCVAFDPAPQSKLENFNERPTVAILPFAFDIEITRLSTVKSVEETLSDDDEASQLAETLMEIRSNARWMLLSRLAVGNGFRFVSREETDALVEELQIAPNTLPTAEQCAEFRRRLGADLLIATNILDYGKVRWQWAAMLAFADLAAETIIIGLASGGNPALILGNVGIEVLANSAIFFGGGYLFGVAFRPVRVEARVLETTHGYPIWQSMEESVYAYGALKLLPEEVRGRKEAQLTLNLAEIMESLGDSLTNQGFEAGHFRLGHW
ncbi:MAG: hypothetical protein JSR29_09135 [Nitrospira sp.]|nr:hypothetical protein [Nitrospira sp.]